jgi:hypothetical protein
MAFLCWNCNNMSNLADGACDGCGHVPAIMRNDATSDPWVVVGRTTIDGDLKSVAAMFETDDIDELIQHESVHRIHGSYLRPTWWESRCGVDIVCCDIVRRQSEIEAEQRAELKAMARKIDDEELADYLAKPCPECGPHGNAGRVLLLESWVDCTTCRPSPEERANIVLGIDTSKADAALSNYSLTIGGMTFDEVELKPRAADYGPGITIPNTPSIPMKFDPPGHKPGGFQVPGLAELAKYIETQREAVYSALGVPREVLFGDQSSASLAEHHAACWRALYGVQ